MIRLIRLFEEETGYIYPKNYREFMQWHPIYHDWLQKKLVKLIDEPLNDMPKCENNKICFESFCNCRICTFNESSK